MPNLAFRLGANISILREKQVDGVEDQRDAIKRVAEVLIRRVPDNQQVSPVVQRFLKGGQIVKHGLADLISSSTGNINKNSYI